MTIETMTRKEARLRRVTDGWRLIAIERVNVYPKAPDILRITIDQHAADATLRHALAGITVRQAEEVAA